MNRQLSQQYLRATACIDSDHPDVVAFTERVVGNEGSDVDQAVALYYAVRDGFRYDPYRVNLTPDGLRASTVLRNQYGFCIPKAVLLAASARVLDIPSRLGFADVRNHLATEKLLRMMQTDLFVFHGYAELFLRNRWVKATPAFNLALCERFEVEPLEFDGRHDALFQQYNRRGQRYMEYVADRGQFADVPLEAIAAAFHLHYPALMASTGYDLSGDFEEEAGGRS